MDERNVTDVTNTWGTQPKADSNMISSYGNDKFLRGKEMAGSMEQFSDSADSVTTASRQGGRQ